MKKALFLIFCVIIAFAFCACDDTTIVSPNNETTTKKLINHVSTDEYEASVKDLGNQYVLSVFTNKMHDKFTFSYEWEKFSLDNTGVFFENVAHTKEGKYITYELELEPNSLYEFTFIGLSGASEGLEIGNNLILKGVE